MRTPTSIVPAPPPAAADAPTLLRHERSRCRAAAGHALRVHPGPLGELVHRELTAYADFGHRFGDGLVPRLVAAVLATPSPGPPADGGDR